MIIAWIGYCLLVSALLGLAALASERALGHYRRPVRAAWTAALAGSVVLPIAAYMAPTLVARFATVRPLSEGFSTAIVLPEFTAATGHTGFDWSGLLSTAGIVLAIAWAVSVAAFGMHLFVSHRRLRREMRGWTPGEILDAPVLLSRDRGPAVVGIGKGVIVLPAWISELDESVLRLVFLHESEHLRAGDHRLFSLGLVGVAVMPWNPFAWWQLRRLRLAIEFDCDRRVMARGVEPREYAEALLAVGSRVTALPLAAAAFAERRPAVERRLRRMTEPLRRLRGPRAVIAVGVSALAVLFACNSPLPTDAPGDLSADVAVDGDEDAFGTLSRRSGNAASGSETDASVGPEPLIVIDGVIQADGIGKEALQSLDVASVEVVKGAAAESMYGVRARDGLINITTKGAGASDPEWSASGARVEFSDEAADGPAEVKPRDPSRITLRPTSPDSGASPLIVIDGVVQSPETALSDLGSFDIDHVEIIKGAAAHQLYGDRGKNGVVQIKTRGGG